MRSGVLISVWLLAGVVWAQDGQREGRAGWPCVAGRAVDPTYLETAERTGGQVFLFQKGEMGQAGVVMASHFTHPVTLVRAVGQLQGDKEFTFPVDSTVETMLVMASVQCHQAVALFDPRGPEAVASVDTRLQSGRLVRFDKPSFGQWKLRLRGQGLFVFSVLVKSAVTIGVQESKEEYRVTTHGFAGTARVVQLAADGGRVPGGGDYRIAVEGVDELGYAVLRTHAPLIREQRPVQLQARAIVGF